MVIKTIIFDIGDVMVKVDNIKACKKLSNHCNYSSDEIFQVLFRTKFFLKFEKGFITPREYFRQVKKKLTLDISFEKFNTIISDNVKSLNKDVANAILKAKGKYRIILLSNNNKFHYNFSYRKFKPLFQKADKLIISYKVGMRKPEKKIYQYAIKHSKAKPSEILYFDDMGINTRSAQKMGINTVHFSKNTKIKQIFKKYGIILG